MASVTAPVRIHRGDFTIPPPGGDSDAYVRQQGWQQGDLVNLGDYRWTDSYIVTFNADNDKYDLLGNPDDSGSGYLTIPSSVTSGMSDVINRYRDVINDADVSFVNFRFDGSQQWAVETLGHQVAAHWQFDLHFTQGSPEDLFIRPDSQSEWQRFDVTGITYQDVDHNLLINSLVAL